MNTLTCIRPLVASFAILGFGHYSQSCQADS